MRVARKASREGTRQQNRRLVFQEIFANRGVSRADIARSSGLTRATVSTLVSDLVAEGLVRETGTGPSAGGKPPVLLELVDDAHHLITLDLSGRELRGAVINLRGNTVATLEQDSPIGQGDAAVENLATAIAHLQELADAPILGVGVGSPGVVDPSGLIVEAPNLGWHRRPLGEELTTRSGLTVHVVNDSQAAALAEFSARPDARNLIVVNAGPGIGAGIILEGRLFRGDGFGAGEIGHISIADGPLCTCGNSGCLESIASAPVILAAIAEGIENFPEADPNEAWQRVRDLQDAGDPNTVDVIERAGKALGTVLAYVVGILDIHQVAIVGEIAAAGPALLESAKAELQRRVLPALAETIVLHLGTGSADLVTRGAATLVLNRELGVA